MTNKPSQHYRPVASLGPAAPLPGWRLRHYPSADPPASSLPPRRDEQRGLWPLHPANDEWTDPDGQTHTGRPPDLRFP